MKSFAEFFDELERRHFATLTFAEMRKAVQALSVRYVEKRSAGPDRALDSAGKRHAFALFYGALHYLVIANLVRELDLARDPIRELTDLGCGTGVAGAAWARAFEKTPRITGIDGNAWAVSEARWTYRTLGLDGSARIGDVLTPRLPGRGAGILLAFTANELVPDVRRELLDRLRAASTRGASVLIVEPIARRVTPWWNEWAEAFSANGGRASDHRFRADLPPRLVELDNAAGLDHRELTCRALLVRRAAR